MKFKKTMSLLFAMLLLGVAFLPDGQVSAAYGGGFRNENYFYDYESVATVNGTWGANLFEGNDQNKQFVRILPVDSQWKVYGYTRRADNYYYWAGGDLWIQANQVRVPVENNSDVLLNVVTKYRDDDFQPDQAYWLPISVPDYTPTSGYWGDKYSVAHRIPYTTGVANN